MRRTPKAQAVLTPEFIQRTKATGMTDTGIADAIGVTRQFYSQVKKGYEPPTVNFILGAIRAGLAENFSDVAMPKPEPTEQQVAA